MTATGLPALIIGAWWLLSADSTSFYFPPLREIVEAGAEQWRTGELQRNLGASAGNWVIALCIILIAGIGAGFVLGRYRGVHQALFPVLEFARSMPAVVLLPVMLLVLGQGRSMQVAAIAYAAVWPVLLNSIEGFRSAGSQMDDVARSYRLSRWDRVTRIEIPAALPRILSGVAVSLPLAVGVVVIAEMVGSTEGLGHAILRAQQTFEVRDMWFGTIVIGSLGYVVTVVYRWLCWVLLRWHPETN
ncbi:ABC transporter permease [Nocardioides sp. GXZ039]|uniref:ABC transporter permease n=1 Tax=Nocardioides sp. GXZ039 TaxID=3136018 RepID=UPI0030F49991